MKLESALIHEFFHVAPGFGDVLLEQPACALGVPLTAELQNGSMLIPGMPVSVARKKNMQANISIGVVIDGLN